MVIIIMSILAGAKKRLFKKNNIRMKKVITQYIGEYVLDFSFFLV